MKAKSKRAVSIIGGADGPTSIFLAGRTGKTSLKIRIRNARYKRKRKRAEKNIHAGAHTLEEVLTYAREQYGISEVDTAEPRYIEQKKCLKESLIFQQKPEILGELYEIKKPKEYNAETIRDMSEQLEKRSKRIAEIPDSEMPMDFHIYEIKYEDGSLEMGIEYQWNVFGISYSGSKKSMKKGKKLAQELYLYYGVSEEDIREKTERYSALVTMLST